MQIKKVLIIFIIILGAIYTISYLFLSRISMYDDKISTKTNTFTQQDIWAFGTLQQQMHTFSDKNSEKYKTEKNYSILYWPFIKLDKYILGNYHILESDLPYLGG